MKAGVVGSEGNTRLGSSLRHWRDFIGGVRPMQISTASRDSSPGAARIFRRRRRSQHTRPHALQQRWHPLFCGAAAPTLAEEDKVAIRCTLTRACQAEDEERAFFEGTADDLAGGFRLAHDGGWCEKTLVHSLVRGHRRSQRWIGGELAHFVQAIDDVMKSYTDAVHGGEISTDHRGEESFGALQLAVDAP